METLSRIHKKRVEELEKQQEDEIRELIKRIRFDHVYLLFLFFYYFIGL
jgi:hypothetical protein